MSAYIKGVQARLAAAHEAQHAEQERAAEQAAREKLVPLQVRVARLIETIPPAVQAEGLSLLALQAQLRARGRGHSRCHVGELGDALRKLGFTRERRWSGGVDGFQAVWRKEH